MSYGTQVLLWLAAYILLGLAVRFVLSKGRGR